MATKLFINILFHLIFCDTNKDEQTRNNWYAKIHRVIKNILKESILVIRKITQWTSKMLTWSDDRGKV